MNSGDADGTPFWKGKSLEDFSPQEWELLCDGCGKCCLLTFEDEGGSKLIVTSVACRFFDSKTCRCQHYGKRSQMVPTCLRLTPARVKALSFIPETCAYRLLAEEKDLEWWHPLKSGDGESVHRAGISVRGKTISEDNVHPEDLTRYIDKQIRKD